MTLFPSSEKVSILLAAGIQLKPKTKTILRSIFDSAEQIEVEKEYSGGWSGTEVLQVRVLEAEHPVKLPILVKIGPVSLISKEQIAYEEWVRDTLPNAAQLKAIYNIATDTRLGVLCYSLAGGDTFPVISFHDYSRENNMPEIRRVLEERLFRVLGHNWWSNYQTKVNYTYQVDYDNVLPVNLYLNYVPATHSENVITVENGDTVPEGISGGDIVCLKGYCVEKVVPERALLTLNCSCSFEEIPFTSYRVRIEAVPNLEDYEYGQSIDILYGEVQATRRELLIHQANKALGTEFNLTADRFLMPGGLSLPNPLSDYQAILHKFRKVRLSTIHGDLNLENILVDTETSDVTLIDFSAVHKGHVLFDLLRLETEVMFTLLPPILTKTNLPVETTLYEICMHLFQATRAGDWTVEPSLPHPALRKLFMMILCIRRMAHRYLFTPNEWIEYYDALVLCLLGTLKFKKTTDLPDISSPGKIAFLAAAMTNHFTTEKHIVIPPSELERPYGTISPDSKFYIERRADMDCKTYLGSNQPVTLFVQAPRQMGKSSLMRRTLHLNSRERNTPFAFIDFQEFPDRCFQDETSFLTEFCLTIGDAFNIQESIDEYWNSRRTDIAKCGRYLSEHLIPQIDCNFILAMDEVDKLLACPFRSNFFGMLRTWHNSRPFDHNLARMSLFLSSSTEPYLFIDNPHQSPFNVAERIVLQDFSRSEIEELNQRHHSLLNQEEIERLMTLVGGQPFLIRLALYQIGIGRFDFNTLEAQALDDDGPFADYFMNQLRRVLENPDLKQALTDVYTHKRHQHNQSFYRLEAAGWIKREGKKIVFPNELTDRYLKEHLHG